jgi:threonine dehydrogenase-like Zn-dependent dehydrogenase
MRAVVLPGDGSVRLADLPRPTPGPGEVGLVVEASCLCGSDRTLLDGDPLLSSADVVIPGHEFAGTVQSLGAGVSGIAVGDRVAVHVAVGCGRCDLCRAGDAIVCDRMRAIGFDLPGGDADHAVVPAVNCLPLPTGMSALEGALATDMFGTQFAVQERLAVRATDRVLVTGLGPMGLAAVAVAAALGARVIASDPHPDRRALAAALGAVDTLPVDPASEGDLRRSVDVALECSGSPTAQRWAVDSVRPYGRVAFVGEGGPVELDVSRQLLRPMITLVGAWYFPSRGFARCAEFLMQHRVGVTEIVSHTFDLDDAPAAFAALASRAEGVHKLAFTSAG